MRNRRFRAGFLGELTHWNLADDGEALSEDLIGGFLLGGSFLVSAHLFCVLFYLCKLEGKRALIVRELF